MRAWRGLAGDFGQLQPLRSHLPEESARFAILRNLGQLEAMGGEVGRIALVCRLVDRPFVVPPNVRTQRISTRAMAALRAWQFGKSVVAGDGAIGLQLIDGVEGLVRPKDGADREDHPEPRWLRPPERRIPE